MKEGGDPRSLTARQAASCENAKSDPSMCKCRCAGARHGLGRGAVRDLDTSDPHYPTDEAPKDKRRREAEEAARARLDALLGRPRKGPTT